MDPILIAGGGIGGLTVALALAGRGLRSSVLERRAEPGEAGAGIQLGPNAMRVLAGIGVAERLAPIAGRPSAIRVCDGATGRELALLPLGDFIEARHGAPYVVAHRVDLHTALLDCARAESMIDISPGFPVTSWTETADGIAVASPQGEVVTGRALIGADGIWSAVRGRLFPDNRLRYAGKMAARTVIPLEVAAGRFAEPETGVWLGPDAHVVHYPVRVGRDIAVVVVIDAPPGREGWDREIDAKDVLVRLAGFAPELHRFLAAGQDWRSWSLYDPAPLPAWTRGRVALLGDAAHPILPFLAQGGGMAIEDADTLATVLSRMPQDLPAGLRMYESLRKKRVDRVQAASRANGTIFHLKGIAATARNAVLMAVPGRLMMARYDWLYGWTGDVSGSN